MSRRVLIVFFIVIFADMLGMAFMSPLLPELSESMGATGVWIGIISASLGVSRFILLPIFGRIADRTGKKKIFICSGLFMYIFLAMAFTLADSVYDLTAIRFARGIGSAMIVPLARAYVGEISPKGEEGRYMGIFNIAFFFGMGAGPLLGGVIKDLHGFDAVFYTMSGIWAFAFMVALIFVPESKKVIHAVRQKSTSAIKLLKIKMMLAVFVMRTAMGGLIGALNIYIPVYAKDRLLSSATERGILTAAGTIMMGALQGYAGKLADKYSKTKLVIIGQITNTAFFFLIPLTGNFTELLILRLAMSISGALTLPAMAALTTEIGREYGMSSAHSLFNMGMTLGHMLSPILLGIVYDSWLGVGWVFPIIGIVGYIGLVAFYLIVRSDKSNYGRRAAV